MDLVTGATGLVGYSIVAALRARQRPVRCLVRSLDKGRRLLPEDVELAEGDVTDAESVRRAVDGAVDVFHAAGLPEQWLRDPGTFDRVNVGGTRNMVEAALEAGATLIYTSTIDVFAADRGAEYDESVVDPEPKGTFYERSKQEADRVVTDAVAERGLKAVLLHPSGVYGPGPAGSPGLNQLFLDLDRGKVPMLLPGGLPLVFSTDVGEGHVLAAEHLKEGKIGAGSRYILSESYMTLREVAERTLRELGRTKVPPVMPLWFGKAVSAAGELLARVTGRSPLIPKGQLHFLQWLARPQADRARAELGWSPTTFDQGLKTTLRYLDIVTD